MSIVNVDALACLKATGLVPLEILWFNIICIPHLSVIGVLGKFEKVVTSP